MDPIDKLLSELQAEYQQSATSKAEKTQEEEEEKQVNQVKKINLDLSAPSSSLFESSSKGDAIDNILSEVKKEIEEKQLLEEEQKQQAIAEERIRQEKIKAQKLEALKGQAQEWLENLEPLSPEGMWFESFAQSYPSKLEAAIEYLNS